MRRATPVAAMLFAATPNAMAQEDVEFSGHHWSIRGASAVRSRLGRDALVVRSAAAELRGVEFASGTIEFDVAISGPRSFVGVIFHIQEGGTGYGHFYLRPHQTGRFDALQYTPVFNGVSAWQLYPEYNTAIDIPRDRWIHVRLEVDGRRLTVYVDGQSEPAMRVDRLEGEWENGGIALLSNFPADGQPADLFPTAFANFQIRRGSPSPETAVPPSAAAPGTFREWAVSSAVPLTSLPLESLDDVQPAPDGWTVVAAEPSGRVNLARHRGFPVGANTGTVLARLVVRSATDQTKKMHFGFSDRATVFLNGRPVFTGNNTYRSRSLRYLGVMTVDNDALYLPLRRGENELIVAVSESFGGWGLIARFADMDGIAVDAAPPGRPDR